MLIPLPFGFVPTTTSCSYSTLMMQNHRKRASKISMYLCGPTENQRLATNLRPRKTWPETPIVASYRNISRRLRTFESGRRIEKKILTDVYMVSRRHTHTATNITNDECCSKLFLWRKKSPPLWLNCCGGLWKAKQKGPAEIEGKTVCAFRITNKRFIQFCLILMSETSPFPPLSSVHAWAHLMRKRDK